MSSKDDLALLKLNETLIDYCHMKNRDCQTCLINNALKLSDECPVDLSIELINRIKNKEGEREMTEETEQAIAKRIYVISTQIENIKATQINTEQLTAVIRSSNAQVRHIERQKDELSHDDFQQACEMVKDTAEKLNYWESRYKLVLDIIEEWDKDFIQLKADYEMLSEADGKTNKDAEYWKRKCIDINNDYIQLSKALDESNQKLLNLRSEYTDLQTRYAELTDESKDNTVVNDTTIAELKTALQKRTDELSQTNVECNNKQCEINQLSAELGKTREICEQKAHKIRELEAALNNTNERECCGYSDQLIDYYRHELNRRAVKLNEREYEYTAVVRNLEKVNAECETWKQRYKELNQKFDNNAVKFTDAQLKADAIAMSYDELAETLHAVEPERDKYKEKYEVTKKLLDAETDASDNTVLFEQVKNLLRENKLLLDTKESLVNELLDLRFLIHRLRLQEENTNTDNTEEAKL